MKNSNCVRWKSPLSLSFVCAVFYGVHLIIGSVRGQDEVDVGDEQPRIIPKVMVEIKKELEQLFQGEFRETKVRFDDDRLIAEYLTREFTIHGIGKDAEANGPFKRIGPTARGFKIEITPNKEMFVPQASGSGYGFGEYRKTYWSTYGNEFHVKKDDVYLTLEIDYGAVEPTKLLNAVVRILHRHGEPTFFTPWKHPAPDWGGSY